MPRIHKTNTPTARAIRDTARANRNIICWWCGNRPLNGKWDGDHVMASVPHSPIVATCSSCNRGRNGKVPDAVKTRRLFHDTGVLSSVPQPRLREWCLFQAKTRLGSASLVDCLIAKEPGKIIYRHSKEGRAFPAYENIYFSDCETPDAVLVPKRKNKGYNPRRSGSA